MARLLVVDDEQDVRDLIVKRLRDDGHDVLAAGSGTDALAAVARHGLPEAAILDIDLPDMDGVELLGRLRQHRTDLPAMYLSQIAVFLALYRRLCPHPWGAGGDQQSPVPRTCGGWCWRAAVAATSAPRSCGN